MKITINGEELDATPLHFTPGPELFSEYKLGDGSVIRVKLAMTRILRVDGRSNPDGSPMYHFQFQAISIVDDLFSGKPTKPS